jgi:hypothetical protein
VNPELDDPFDKAAALGTRQTERVDNGSQES